MKKDKGQETPKPNWSISRIRKFFGNMGINRFAELFKSTQRCKTKKCKNKAISGILYCEKHKQTVPADTLIVGFTVAKEQMQARAIVQARILRSKGKKQILEYNSLFEFKRYKRYLRKCLRFVERAQKRHNHTKVAFHSAELKRAKAILYGGVATITG